MSMCETIFYYYKYFNAYDRVLSALNEWENTGKWDLCLSFARISRRCERQLSVTTKVRENNEACGAVCGGPVRARV